MFVFFVVLIVVFVVIIDVEPLLQLLLRSALESTARVRPPEGSDREKEAPEDAL